MYSKQQASCPHNENPAVIVYSEIFHTIHTRYDGRACLLTATVRVHTSNYRARLSARRRRAVVFPVVSRGRRALSTTRSVDRKWRAVRDKSASLSAPHARSSRGRFALHLWSERRRFVTERRRNVDGGRGVAAAMRTGEHRTDRRQRHVIYCL